MHLINLALAAIFSIALLIACNTPSSNINTEHPETEITIQMPEFSADSAFLFTKKQVDFGPRVPGSAAHAECLNFIEQKLKEYAPDVHIQSFETTIWNGKRMTGKNIIASFDPTNARRILLAAHWDSRPTADHDPDPANYKKPVPGANDGASGVGVLLEIARAISQQAPNVGIDIVFFDLEDWGTPENERSEMKDTWCLGAQYWSENSHVANYDAMYGILLDMVGCRNPYFRKDGVSMYYAADIVQKVWEHAHALGYEAFFSTQENNGLIDDHLYINQFAKIPTIDIIQYDPATGTSFFPQWHTVNDDMAHVEKSTLEIVGRTVLRTIYAEK